MACLKFINVCLVFRCCAELLEAAFLVLDTLALANRDVAAAVSQQRVAALTSLCLQVPVEQLVQQQALGLHWITSLAAAVSRNKSMLESMNADGTQGAAVAVGLQQTGIRWVPAAELSTSMTWATVRPCHTQLRQDLSTLCHLMCCCVAVAAPVSVQRPKHDVGRAAAHSPQCWGCGLCNDARQLP